MLRQAYEYVRHVFRSKRIYSVHSPFVYSFYRSVLQESGDAVVGDIAQLRKTLIRDSRQIERLDFGAGSSGKKPTQQKSERLGNLVQKASRRKKTGELLYKLCRQYQPQRCLEFGTHVGISSLYQASALRASTFVSMEGDPSLAAIANENFQQFPVDIQQYTGEFSQLLQQEIDLDSLRPDYVFFDGNHQYQATLDYFHQILPHMPDQGIMVFDDIYWSKGMTKSWEEIIQHPEVTVSIDLYFLGLCFIRRKQEKEHFRFRC